MLKEERSTCSGLSYTFLRAAGPIRTAASTSTAFWPPVSLPSEAAAFEAGRCGALRPPLAIAGMARNYQWNYQYLLPFCDSGSVSISSVVCLCVFVYADISLLIPTRVKLLLPVLRCYRRRGREHRAPPTGTYAAVAGRASVRLRVKAASSKVSASAWTTAWECHAR